MKILTISLAGIGDTIRVSLTEDSVHEIPVAKALVEALSAHSSGLEGISPVKETRYQYDPFSYQRRPSGTVARRNMKR